MDGIEGIEGNRVELKVDVQIDVIEENVGVSKKNISHRKVLNTK